MGQIRGMETARVYWKESGCRMEVNSVKPLSLRVGLDLRCIEEMWDMNSRGTLFHMRESVFRHSKHLQDIAAKCAFHIVEINLGEIVAHDLLRGIVDENMDLVKAFDMLVDSRLAVLVVH